MIDINEIDLDRLHDILVEVNGRSYTEAQLKQIFQTFPTMLQRDCWIWEFDTETSEAVYRHLKRHGVPQI